MAIAVWDHLYPCRTQKLSTYTPKVLVWQRTGRIGSCWLDVLLLQGIYYSSIAQSVERLTVNQNVTGSSPVRGAILYLQRRRRFGDTDRMIGVPVDSWGIAKSVKARDFDSRIRWFESNCPSQYSFCVHRGFRICEGLP